MPKLKVRKEGKKYLTTFFGIEYELEMPEEKTTKKSTKKSSKKDK